MADTSNHERTHGTGLLISIPIGLAIWGAAYYVAGWTGLAVLAGVTVVIGAALAIDEHRS